MEFKHEGGYSDGCFEPLFTAEFQDENGNTLSKDKTDIVWDKDELVSLAALLVDESCTIGFEMNNEKASRVKLSSTFEVHESSPSSVLNEDDFGETVHHFVGKVAGSNVHLSMNIDGSSVLGRYYYDSQRKKGNKSSMKFFGEKDDDSLELTEFFTDHPTGQFEGDWREGVYKGTFTRAKDGKTFDFELVETDGGEEFFTEEELAFEIPDFEVDINLDFGFSDSGSTDWDEVLDEYEKFVNSYVSFVNKASNGNVTALAEYAEMLEKAEEFSSKLDSAKGDMSTAQMNRLLKLENKMASVATKAAGLMNKMDDLDLDDLLNDATNGLFGDDDDDDWDAD